MHIARLTRDHDELTSSNNALEQARAGQGAWSLEPLVNGPLLNAEVRRRMRHIGVFVGIVALVALLALMLLSSVACSGSPQADLANGNAPQTNSDQWEPSSSIPGGFRRDLIGDTRQPGPFKYQLKIPAGVRVAAHRHSRDVHVKVLAGSMFIIIGEPLESARAQRFAAGSVFVVPAHAWHDEWWDQETVLEAEGVGPMETVYKSQ